MSVIIIDHICKRYGDVVAVDDVTFTVEAGEVFGMVGPNGAGKTTTIEIIEGLRRADAGHVQVLGMDPQRDGYALRQRIGVQLQSTALYDKIRVREVLRLFATFYRQQANVDELLDLLSLQPKAGSYFHTLSGGQKQRVALALALINDPEVLFLDELTTGLDPQARRSMWDLIRQIASRGKTVMLTTHYMEEAERLCGRVAIIDHGRIIALDTPPNLIAQLGSQAKLVFQMHPKAPLDWVQDVEDVQRVERTADQVVVYVARADGSVERLIQAGQAHGVTLGEVRTEQVTLDDVFLYLTGREVRE
jgi:ABC-2 type transport system ATP-binding protein